MKQINWKDIDEAKDYAYPGAGGYVCRIVKVEDKPDREYLLVEMDISEGEFKGFAETVEASTGNDWSYIRLYRSYKEKARRMFAAFLGTLERSNPGRFTKNGFDGDEQKMVGLTIGVVLGQEEYEKKDGDIGLRTVVKKITTPEKIRKGDFTLPELKKLVVNQQTTPESTVNDADLPF